MRDDDDDRLPIMKSSSVFLTGGTGFIGQRLLKRLTERSHRVRCLVRHAAAPRLKADAGVVVGDLRDPESYVDALRGSELVVHLAAATGKAPRAEYLAVNVDGTRAVLDACRRAGVRRFLCVSSIAATYDDKTFYYYAQSKQLAEQAVRQSGLNYLIVRPTIVLGQGSPIWNRLVGLARLPVVPILGAGAVRVQPIYLDDVVTFLTSMIEGPTFPDRAVDLGGPDAMTFEQLLRRIRRGLGLRDAPMVHLPVRHVMRLLNLVEPWLYPILPVTAGQLSAFVNDSVAAEDPLVAGAESRMHGVDGMLQLLIAHG